MQVPHFIGPSYTVQSNNADAEICMNWAVEGMESPGAKTPAILVPTAGFQEFDTVDESPGRGVFATGELVNRVFGVFAFKLYEFEYDSVTGVVTATDRGTVANDERPVTFATNSTAGGQMMLTSAGTLYVYDLDSNSLTAISALSAATLSQVVYLANRFVALDATQSAYYWSDLTSDGGGANWSLGSKAVRSTAADPWVSMSVVLGQLWLLGTLTSDVYYPTDDPNDPYAPIPGALLEQGSAAQFGGANVDSTLVWLASNANGRGTVRRSNGYTPERISTHAVELAIQSYGDISDAIAFAYQEQGHSYYVLSFPTAETTWCYDTSTGMWHQRGYWTSETTEYLPYRAQYACSAFGKTLTNDIQTAILSEMSVSFTSEADGSVIRRQRRAPNTWDGQSLNNVRYPGMQIDVQTGLGGPAVTDDPPLLELNIYKNNNFGHPAISRRASGGNLGQYAIRLQFLNLGAARVLTPEIICTDTIPWRVTQAVFRPEPMVGAS